MRANSEVERPLRHHTSARSWPSAAVQPRQLKGSSENGHTSLRRIDVRCARPIGRAKRPACEPVHNSSAFSDGQRPPRFRHSEIREEDTGRSGECRLRYCTETPPEAVGSVTLCNSVAIAFPADAAWHWAERLPRSPYVVPESCLDRKLQLAISNLAMSSMFASIRCCGPATATANISPWTLMKVATAQTSMTFSPRVTK